LQIIWHNFLRDIWRDQSRAGSFLGGRTPRSTVAVAPNIAGNHTPLIVETHSQEPQMRSFHVNCALELAPHDAESRDLVYYFSSDLCHFVLLKYTEQGIQSLVRLAGYRQLISSLVIFDLSRKRVLTPS
jgi:hypothetical protein